MKDATHAFSTGLGLLVQRKKEIKKDKIVSPATGRKSLSSVLISVTKE